MSDNILEIDKLNLDEECAQHPILVEQYMRELADAKFKADRAKANLDLVEADLDSDIRIAPAKYGLEKATEKAIENTLVKQNEYQKALNTLHKANQLVGTLQAMVTALDHRKYALKSLVDMWAMEYFSKPSIDNSKRESLEEQQKLRARSRGRRRMRSEIDDE